MLCQVFFSWWGRIFSPLSHSAVVWHPPSGLFGIPRPLLFSRESGSSDVSAQRVRLEPLPLALAGALPDFYTAQGAGLPLAVGLTLTQRRLAVEILGSWRISCAPAGQASSGSRGLPLDCLYYSTDRAICQALFLFFLDFFLSSLWDFFSPRGGHRWLPSRRPARPALAGHAGRRPWPRTRPRGLHRNCKTFFSSPFFSLSGIIIAQTGQNVKHFFQKRGIFFIPPLGKGQLRGLPPEWSAPCYSTYFLPRFRTGGRTQSQSNFPVRRCGTGGRLGFHGKHSFFYLPFFVPSGIIIAQAGSKVKSFFNFLRDFFNPLKNHHIVSRGKLGGVEAPALVINFLLHILALDNQTIHSGVEFGGLGLGFLPCFTKSNGVHKLKTRNLIHKLFSHFFVLPSSFVSSLQQIKPGLSIRKMHKSGV